MESQNPQMNDLTLIEVVEDFDAQHNTGRTDGIEGVKNLCRLVRAIGYEDGQHFGQFRGACYGDLIQFLEDNPGCVEAIRKWIVDVDLNEWRENILSEVQKG